MGVAGVLGGALLSAIHRATVRITLFAGGDAAHTLRAFTSTQSEDTSFVVQQTDSVRRPSDSHSLIKDGYTFSFLYQQQNFG